MANGDVGKHAIGESPRIKPEKNPTRHSYSLREARPAPCENTYCTEHSLDSRATQSAIIQGACKTRKRTNNKCSICSSWSQLPLIDALHSTFGPSNKEYVGLLHTKVVHINDGINNGNSSVKVVVVGLFSVHFWPIYDNFAHFPTRRMEKKSNAKTFFAPRFLRVGKQSLAWTFMQC